MVNVRSLEQSFLLESNESIDVTCACYKIAHIGINSIISTFVYEKHFVLHISCLSNIL